MRAWGSSIFFFFSHKLYGSPRCLLLDIRGEYRSLGKKEELCTLFAFAFANKNRLAFAEILSQWFECELYTGDSDWAIPNEFKPMRGKHLYDVDMNLISFVCFVVATTYSKTNQSETSFLYKLTNSYHFSQRRRREERLRLQQCKCTYEF